MSNQPDIATQRDEGMEALRTYLRDHVMGAEHAVQLLRALKEEHQGTSLGAFAGMQLQQVEEDLATLEGVAKRLGAEGLQVRELAGWISDKLSRFKLAPGGGWFNTFEVLEVVGLGILGKRALWRALMTVSSTHSGLQEVNLEALIERAERQYSATEEMRLQVAKQAFA